MLKRAPCNFRNAIVRCCLWRDSQEGWYAQLQQTKNCRFRNWCNPGGMDNEFLLCFLQLSPREGTGALPGHDRLSQYEVEMRRIRNLSLDPGLRRKHGNRNLSGSGDILSVDCEFQFLRPGDDIYPVYDHFRSGEHIPGFIGSCLYAL